MVVSKELMDKFNSSLNVSNQLMDTYKIPLLYVL